MIGIIINLISSRIDNVKKINDYFYKNENFNLIYICQLDKDSFNKLKYLNSKYKNIYFELANKNSLSNCKNQGINFFNQREDIKFVWFWDDDCSINKKSINNLVIKIRKTNVDCLIVKIFSKDKGTIGRNLWLVKYIPQLAKYIVGGPSIIAKKSSIIRYFDLDFGYGGKTSNAEDTKFMIDNNFKNIELLKDDIFIYHPNQKTTNDRIKKYSYGQGYMFKKIPFLNFTIFSILCLYRPLIGIFFSFIKLDIQKMKFYIFRIQYFFKGVKNSIDIKNTNH